MGFVRQHFDFTSKLALLNLDVVSGLPQQKTCRIIVELCRKTKVPDPKRNKFEKLSRLAAVQWLAKNPRPDLASGLPGRQILTEPGAFPS